MPRSSVRLRLTLWYTAVLGVVLLGFASLSYYAIRQGEMRAVDAVLSDASIAFVAELSAESDEEAEHEEAGEEGLAETARAFGASSVWLGVYDERGELLAATDGGAGPPASSERLSAFAIGAAVDPVAAATLGGDDGVRAVASRLSMRGKHRIVVAARSLAPVAQTLAGVGRAYAAAVPFALLAAALGGWLLARKSLEPLARMGARAERIGVSNLSERLEVGDQADEFGRLAAAFNGLLARLEDAFERQRRFMADASHELRTPVAIVRGESEVALSRLDRDSADYRESLGIVHDEGLRLTRIVDDLFTLARADSGDHRLVPATFYLDEVVAETARALRALAHARGVTLTAYAGGEALVRGDEGLVRRMVVNLLDNAIKYTPEGGAVLVRVALEAGGHSVTVHNTGPEIPADVRPFVFDRFFRADKARSRSTWGEGGGAGLGLSIALWIAEAHGGSLELVETGPGGTTFAARLPGAGTEDDAREEFTGPSGSLR